MKGSVYYALGLYGAVGVQLAASVVAGLFLGDWLDGKLGTSPWLTLIGCLTGTAGGIWNLAKMLKWSERSKNGA